jgi:hypothetical protein
VARDPSRLPSLRRELLVNLAILVAAALFLAIATALLVAMLDPRFAALALAALVAADVAVVFVFGRHLLDRLVLKPMAALRAAADDVAAGNLARRAPPAETRDFTELGQHWNVMTERLVSAQNELLRTEKLATVGRFAAGVAHEVGNPLSAIATYLDVLQARGADPDLVAAVSREVGRIDRIVRGLLDYARPAREGTVPVDLGQVVRTVHELLDRQGAFKSVEVRLECREPVPLVSGNPHHLEQVVVNLLLNAADAAPGGLVVAGVVPWRYRAPEGTQLRRTDTAPVGEAQANGRGGVRVRGGGAPLRPDLAPGTFGVLLYVADSGPGVPPEDRERVFDPFFTTKAPGFGTGLGLAVVQRTVHQSGGVVWVETAREGGAAFKVFLPAIAERASCGS